jgi:hypothetical protein
MTPGPAGPFEVVRSEAIRQRLRHWGTLARTRGRLAEFASLISWAEEQLRNRPLEWGDPLYRLRQLNLPIYRGIRGYLVVEYGVKEDERLVFIKDYRLLPGNPLE